MKEAPEILKKAKLFKMQKVAKFEDKQDLEYVKRDIILENYHSRNTNLTGCYISDPIIVEGIS